MSSLDWSFSSSDIPSACHSYQLQTFLHSTRPFLSSSSLSFHSSFSSSTVPSVQSLAASSAVSSATLYPVCLVWTFEEQCVGSCLWDRMISAGGRDRYISRPRPTAGVSALVAPMEGQFCTSQNWREPSHSAWTFWRTCSDDGDPIIL